MKFLVKQISPDFSTKLKKWYFHYTTPKLSLFSDKKILLDSRNCSKCSSVFLIISVNTFPPKLHHLSILYLRKGCRCIEISTLSRSAYPFNSIKSLEQALNLTILPVNVLPTFTTILCGIQLKNFYFMIVLVLSGSPFRAKSNYFICVLFIPNKRAWFRSSFVPCAQYSSQ